MEYLITGLGYGIANFVLSIIAIWFIERVQGNKVAWKMMLNICSKALLVTVTLVTIISYMAKNV